MPNKLEVTLSFNPIMSGLEKFASAIEQRMERVRAFNLRIENGAKATNQLLASAAAAISGAKIVDTFTGIVKGGVSFNAQLEQARLGIAAVLKQFDDTGKFKNFDDAITASANAIELLKKKAIESPASFAQLVQAFQGTVGPMTAANIPLEKQVNLIVNMSQALAGLGIRSEQILQETRALITGNINADAAAAKILGVTSADVAQAKAKGQLYEFLAGKISAFAEAGARGAKSLETLRSNFGDALEQRAAAATERINDALKTLYTRLTDLAQSPAFSTVLGLVADKTAGIVDGVASLVASMQDLGTGTHVLLSLASATSNWLLIATALVLPFVALRGVWSGLLTMANPLRMAFVFLAGINFAGALKDLQMFSRELGIITTIKIADWGRLAAGAIAALGLAFAAFTAGTAVIKGLENAALQRVDAEDQVRQKLADETRELTQQLAAIRSITESRKASAAIEEQLNKAVAERDKLEAKRAAAQQAAELNRSLGGNATAADYFGDEEAARLDALERQIFDLAQRFRLANDAAFVAQQIGANAKRESTTLDQAALKKLVDQLPELRATRAEQSIDALAPADRALALMRERANLEEQLANEPKGLTTEQSEARRLDLQNKIYAVSKLIADAQKEISDQVDRRLKQGAEREIFALETQALQAEAAGNTKLAEQLREQIKLKQYQQELEGADPKIVQARVDAERAVTEEKRRQAELDNELGRRIAGVQSELQRVQQSPYLTDDQKRQVTAATVDEITAAYQRRIEVLERLQAAASGDEAQQIQARIDSMRDSIRGLQEQLTVAPASVGQGLVSGLVDYLNQIPTLAMRARQSLLSIANGLQNGIAGSLDGLIRKTMTWRDALLNIGNSVINAVIGAFVNMAAQWIVQQIVMAVAGKAIQAAQLAALAPLALGTAALWAPAATAASIATFGAAAITGAAMAQAAILGSIVGFATGGLFEGPGYVSGPGTATSDSINARLSDGEYVNRAAVVDKFGVSFFDRLNSGILDLTALPGDVAAGVAAPLSSAGGSAAAAGPAAGAHGTAVPNVTVINVQSERDATRIARRSRARGDVVQIVREEMPKITRRGPG